jgi:hypothetical protein
MLTTQCNVRVPPGDVGLMKRMAARLRAEPGFRDRLDALLDDRASDPAIVARIAKLESIIEMWQSRNVFLRPKGDGQ